LVEHFLLKITYKKHPEFSYTLQAYNLYILHYKLLEYTACPRRKGQYSGRSKYRSF